MSPCLIFFKIKNSLDIKQTNTIKHLVTHARREQGLNSMRSSNVGQTVGQIGTLQSLTGKYREIQGKPCNENRVPCNESRFFPVGIDLQGKAVSCTGFGFTVNPSLFDVTKATSSNFDK